MKFKKFNKNIPPKFGVYWVFARCPKWSLAPNPLVDIVDPEHKYTFLRMFTGVLGQDPQLSRSLSHHI